MTQQHIDALRDAIIQNTVSELRADRIAAAVETYVAPIAAERDNALRVLAEMGDQLTGTEIDLDAARARADRLRTAWTSARHRATRARAECEQGWETVARYGSELASLRAECEELRRALRSALSSPDTPGVHTTLSHMRKLAGVHDEDLVHVATPEGVTPCGAGVHDVTTTALIREATCLECLSTLAQATHGDTLPEEDLVEPGDEVPDLAEQADRLASVEKRIGYLDQARERIVQRLDAIEEHAAPEKRLAKLRNALDAIKATAPEEPRRFQDKHGDAPAGGAE